MVRQDTLLFTPGTYAFHMTTCLLICQNLIVCEKQQHELFQANKNTFPVKYETYHLYFPFKIYVNILDSLVYFKITHTVPSKKEKIYFVYYMLHWQFSAATFEVLLRHVLFNAVSVFKHFRGC